MSRAIALALLVAGCSCRGAGGERPAESYQGAFGVRIPPRDKIADRYLLVGDRLPAMRERARGSWPAWERLSTYADDPRQKSRGAIENLALAHLIGNKREPARAALALAEELMKADVRGDSYLEFGNDMRAVALVLDHCADALGDEEQRALADYLDRWTNELWFDNRGSGWGLDDPGNNYHMAFLEGTAYAGFALYKRGHPRAERYLRLLYDKLERDGGVIAYLKTRGAGGDWHEGANYGQRAKQRLTSALAVIASMGGPNYAPAIPFFRDSVRIALYQLMPDRRSLYPSGDLARESAMTVSAYDRDYLQTTAFLLADDEARAEARWFASEVVPSYDSGAFRWPEAYFKDVLFATDGPARAPAALPRAYYALGNRWLHVRSDWTENATALSVSGSSVIDQSHAHVDVGSFTLFKGDWQAVDAATFSRSGMLWQAGAHNMVSFAGHERRGAKLGGITGFVHRDGVAYAHVDASGLFLARQGKRDVPLAKEYTRELVYLEPDTLVVYDRVASAGPPSYDFRLHFAEEPTRDGATVHARHGRGAISATIVVGGEPLVRRDDDLEGGASEAWRLQVSPAGGDDAGRYLAALRVALGAPPAIPAQRIDGDAAVDGVVVDDTAVVFSRQPFGRSEGAARYHFPGKVKRHVIVNLPPGSYDVSVDENAAELRKGSRYPADSAGMIIAK